MLPSKCLSCKHMVPHGNEIVCGKTPDKVSLYVIKCCPVGKFYPAGTLPPPADIDPDYVPTPTNATLGGCGCKK
jgi:hypothetical protein